MGLVLAFCIVWTAVVVTLIYSKVRDKVDEDQFSQK